MRFPTIYNRFSEKICFSGWTVEQRSTFLFCFTWIFHQNLFVCDLIWDLIFLFCYTLISTHFNPLYRSQNIIIPIKMFFLQTCRWTKYFLFATVVNPVTVKELKDVFLWRVFFNKFSLKQFWTWAETKKSIFKRQN